jgi:hypothetical protein
VRDVPLRVFVNLSAPQRADLSLLDAVSEVLEQASQNAPHAVGGGGSARMLRPRSLV